MTEVIALKITIVIAFIWALFIILKNHTKYLKEYYENTFYT